MPRQARGDVPTIEAPNAMRRAHSRIAPRTVSGTARKSDFREQHERLFPLTETLGDRPEIDFRLARACDPVEQNRIKPFPMADARLAAASRCSSLSSGGVVGIRAGEGPVGVNSDGLKRSRIDEAAQHAVADPGGQQAHGSCPWSVSSASASLRREAVGYQSCRPVLRQCWGPIERGGGGSTIRNTDASGDR